MNVFDHRVWDQVFDAHPSSESPAHLGGAGLVPHPLPHQVDVPGVACERVRLVHSPLGLQRPPTDADEAEAADHLLHVVISPHAGNFECV